MINRRETKMLKLNKKIKKKIKKNKLLDTPKIIKVLIRITIEPRMSNTQNIKKNIRHRISKKCPINN